MNKFAKIKPSKGFSDIFHRLLVSVVPIVIYVLVTISFSPIAYIVVVLSKWRMLAVRPRHWPANIRANAVDIFVGLSVVSFMAESPSQAWRFVWALFYGIWLVVVKPKSSTLLVSIQAGIGQLVGLAAIYVLWGHASLAVLVLSSWLVCYLSARHFMSSFDEPLSSLLSHIWGYFGAALTWVLGHWLLYYGFISQPMLLLSVISVGLAALYYLENNDKLSKLVRREILLITSAIIVVIILFSSWADRAV